MMWGVSIVMGLPPVIIHIFHWHFPWNIQQAAIGKIPEWLGNPRESPPMDFFKVGGCIGFAAPWARQCLSLQCSHQCRGQGDKRGQRGLPKEQVLGYREYYVNGCTILIINGRTIIMEVPWFLIMVVILLFQPWVVPSCSPRGKVNSGNMNVWGFWAT